LNAYYNIQTPKQEQKVVTKLNAVEDKRMKALAKQQRRKQVINCKIQQESHFPGV
jgi:hypothetical protein